MLMLSISARAVVALIVVTAGCPSAGPGAQGSYQQDHMTVDAPGGRFDLLLTREQHLSSDTLTIAPSRAWPALVQTYASFGVPIQGADAARHVIATQYVHAHATFAGERMSRWLECGSTRSEEHTSELQSPCNLVCRLLLEKKKNKRLWIRPTRSLTY